MKRFLNAIIFICTVIFAFGAPVDKDLAKFRNDIYNFLAKQNTNPQFSSEDKIMFSVTGTVYVLSISPNDVSPMYLTLSSTFNLDGDYVPELVQSTTSQINNNKMVKFTTGDDWVCFQEEMYVANAPAFTSIFPTLIASLENAKMYFESYYEQLAESYEAEHPSKDNLSQPGRYTEVTQVHTVSPAFSSDATPVMVNGSTISTRHHDWECLSLQTDNEKTVLVKRVVPKTTKSSIFSSYIEFIEDAQTGKKYYLEDSEIGFENNPEVIIDGSTRIFCESYPPLPPSVKVINISGGSQYYVKDLKIR